MHQLFLLILKDQWCIIFLLLHTSNLPLEVGKTKPVGHCEVATKHVSFFNLIQLLSLGAVDIHQLTFDVRVGLGLNFYRDVSHTDSLSDGALSLIVLIFACNTPGESIDRSYWLSSHSRSFRPLDIEAHVASRELLWKSCFLNFSVVYEFS